jgi:hypothetical protein
MTILSILSEYMKHEVTVSPINNKEYLWHKYRINIIETKLISVSRYNMIHRVDIQ